MGKLVMKDNGQNRQFKLHESIKLIEVEDKQDAITNSEVFRTGFRSDSKRSNTLRGRPRYRQDYCKVGQGMIRTFRGNYRNNMRGNQRYGR